MTVLKQFWKGDQKALATLISHVENQAEDYQKVLSSIYSKTGRAYKIGITGPPGVGKSSLVDKLTLKLCQLLPDNCHGDITPAKGRDYPNKSFAKQNTLLWLQKPYPKSSNRLHIKIKQ